MPVEVVQYAQYGIAFFILAIGAYLGKEALSAYKAKVTCTVPEVPNKMEEVVKNNTQAMDNLSTVLSQLQISMARQEEKMDELLRRQK